jgi:RNA polymerase sigma-70 factor, ECF subfamily
MPEAASSDTSWVEPFPDMRTLDPLADPAELAIVRQTLRLALIVTAQILPPRQRAAFFLCDVLVRPAAEAAAILEVSIGALKSLLQRARARLAQQTTGVSDLTEPTDAGALQVLGRYMTAFEQSDMAEIERLLVDDAVLEMTGTTTWFAGKTTCVPFIAAQGIGQRGDWRMIPIAVNGQLAVAAYRLDADATYHPFAIVVLATTSSRLTRISLFAEARLFSYFGLPSTIPVMTGD